MNRTIIRLTFGSLLGVVLLGGCKKDPLNNLTNDESRIYITNYDTTANFSSYSTFSIADSVAVIQDNQFAGRQKNGFDSLAINAVTQLMQQRGYQKVGTKDSPHLAIDVSRIYNTSTGVFSYGDYWDYYGGYWDPYYWGYPGYGYYDPFAVGVYTIQSGALEIDLLDLKNAAANGNKLKAIWTGMARGNRCLTPPMYPTR
ncbi:DUF4136 domain-containing protein [Puia sp. P3]|uniref:DUF4136 domain-containing protein n=1 Tax=Puia sp. P3 TaxID=3423952 RepID=UPI003D666509